MLLVTKRQDDEFLKSSYLLSITDMNENYLYYFMENSPENFYIPDDNDPHGNQYVGKLKFSDFENAHSIKNATAVFTIIKPTNDESTLSKYKNVVIKVSALDDHMKELQTEYYKCDENFVDKTSPRINQMMINRRRRGANSIEKGLLYECSSHFQLNTFVDKMKAEPLVYHTWNFSFEFESTTSIKPKPTFLSSKLQDNLVEFLNNEKFSDVVLEVKGTKLKAHKMVLSAQSNVFATMFEQKGMTETEENHVKINDIEPNVAKKMLEFIYTDKEPSEIDEFAYDLLPVAHKYELDGLSLMCQSILSTKISEESALKFVVFAHMYEATKLKRSCIDFIRKNSSLLESMEFQELDKKHQEVAIEIYRELLMKKYKNTK